MDTWSLRFAKALAIAFPLIATYVAFNVFWTLPGEAQMGPALVTQVPISILGLPWNLLGYFASVKAICAVTGKLPDEVGEPIAFAAIVVGAVINSILLVRRYNFPGLMALTSIVAIVQAMLLCASRWH